MLELALGSISTPLVSIDSGVNTACVLVLGGNCDVKPENTFAFKVSAGTDYFLNEKFALNADLGWKRNSGSLVITAPGASESADFNASVMTFMFGVKVLFQ